MDWVGSNLGAEFIITKFSNGGELIYSNIEINIIVTTSIV